MRFCRNLAAAAMLAVFLTACGAVKTTPFADPPGPTLEPLITTTINYPGGLSIEEHALKDTPTTEPLAFVPIQGSQQDILRDHQQDRENRFPDRSFVDNGHHAIWANWEGGKLVARENCTASDNQTSVDVSFGDQTIYSLELGAPLAFKVLNGLWTYEDHWILEVVDVRQQPSRVDAVSQIIQDGISLNEKYGYQESFGFQFMGNKPFYFFRKDGKIGIAYDDQEISLGYDEVLHNGCCSASALNPVVAKDMTAFFARRDGAWYYVEIGVFNPSISKSK